VWKTISKIGASVLIHFPKSKLCIIVINVIGFVRTYSYIHIRDVYTPPVPLNQVVSFSLPMYCTYIHNNRFGIVHRLLSYARLSAPPPRQPANGSGTQRKQILTMHTYTQYISHPVHTQSTSPPGGENMYYSEKYMHYVLYKYMREFRLYFTAVFCSKTMQKNYVTITVCTVNSTFKWLRVCSLSNTKIGNASYNFALVSKRPNLSYNLNEHSIRRTELNSRLTSITTNPHNLSSNCTHFSVRIRHSKMSEPGEDSQISRPMSAGEYPIYIPVFSCLVEVSQYYTCMCLYHCNCPLVYGE
jgi:hypothetical protein